MNKTLNLCATACAMTFIATSATAGPLECLQKGISVAAINFDKDVIDSREISIEVTNRLETALGGVWVEYEIWTAERPTPIYKASIREAATISGALRPGETLIASDFHFMDDRTTALARATTNLSIRLHVENAADASMNGFLHHPAMGSWTRKLTDEECKTNAEQ